MATETCTPEHEELTVSMCWALLRLADVGRLALRGDSDDVDVFPVNFVVDHGSIIFRTAEGTKLTRVITEQRATFEADDVDRTAGTAWSVVAKGPTKVISSLDEVTGVFDLRLPSWHGGPKPTFVRLTPEEITGRRIRFRA